MSDRPNGWVITPEAARRYPDLCVYCGRDTKKLPIGSHGTYLGGHTICTDCAVDLKIPTECCGDLWKVESEGAGDV